jgi:putative membrane protein
VRIETIGYGREPAAARTLFPTIPARALDAALAELAPAFVGALGELERPPRRARRRYVAREAAPGLLLGALPAIAWPYLWPAIPLLGIVGALDGLYRHRVAGWRLDAGRIVLRSGSIARRSLIADTHRLQEHSLAQTLPQRRAALETLSITVGSGTTGSIAHLELSTARSLFARLRPAPGRPARTTSASGRFRPQYGRDRPLGEEATD